MSYYIRNTDLVEIIIIKARLGDYIHEFMTGGESDQRSYMEMYGTCSLPRNLIKTKLT